MALEALNRETREPVKLWRLPGNDVRELMHKIDADRRLITCLNADCGCEMYVKALDSSNVTTHFARYPETGKAVYHPATGESEKHRKAKERLAQMLQTKYPGADVTTEHTLVGGMVYSDIRRVDVFVVHEDGRKEAYEIQYGFQTTATTERRTRDYLAKGIDSVVWVWGDQTANNRAYREWCIGHCDYYGTANTVTDRIMGKDLPVDVRLKVFDCREIRARREREEQARLERVAELNDELEALLDTARELGGTVPIVYVNNDNENSLKYAIRELTVKVDRQRQMKALQKGRSLIGTTRLTFTGGKARITDYDPKHDLYLSQSGLWWELKRGTLSIPGAGQYQKH